MGGGLTSWMPGGWAGFAWPWMLLALPVPLLLRWLLPPAASVGPALRVPFGGRLDAVAGSGPLLRGSRLPWLALLAWACLCIAAARPQQLGSLVQPPHDARELIVALDLSGSMSEEDMLLGGRMADRITVAKATISDFLERRAGDRVGLLLFGSRAYMVTLVTADLGSVREQLQMAEVGLPGRETALGDAIGLAVKRMQASAGADGAAPGHERVLVLLTDGVNTAGALEPLQAAALARDAGVRVHTIAFGGDSGQLSMFGFRTTPADSLDEATLQRVSATTGGRMFRARDAAELAGIYAEIDRIEPVSRPAQALRPRVERYPVPLVAALVCGMLALLPRLPLPERLRRSWLRHRAKAAP